MPGNWLYIDTSFPTFTGEESAKEQTETLLNYMTMLVEQLRYSLKNLDASNFNTVALDNIKDETAAPILEELVSVNAQIGQMEQEANRLSGRVSAAESRITALEDRAEALEQRAAKLESKDVDLEKQIGALEERAEKLENRAKMLEERTASLEETARTLQTAAEIAAIKLERLEGVISADGAGNVRIGTEEGKTELVGEVSINGVAQ